MDPHGFSGYGNMNSLNNPGGVSAFGAVDAQQLTSPPGVTDCSQPQSGGRGYMQEANSVVRGSIVSGSSRSTVQPIAVQQKSLAHNNKYFNTSSNYPVTAANQSIFTGSNSYAANSTQNHGAPENTSPPYNAALLDSNQSYGKSVMPPKDPYLENSSSNRATQYNKTNSMPSVMSKFDISQSTRCSANWAIFKFTMTLEQHPDKERSEVILKMLREYDDNISRSRRDAIIAQPNDFQAITDHYEEIAFLMLDDLKNRLELPSTYTNEDVFFNGIMKGEKFGDHKGHSQDSTQKLREKETENSATSLMSVSPQGSTYTGNNSKGHPSSTQDASFKKHSPVDAKDKQVDVVPNELTKIDDTNVTKAYIDDADPDIVTALDELNANVINVPKVNVIGVTETNHNNSHTKKIKAIRHIIADPKGDVNEATTVDDVFENENNADPNNNVPANTAVKASDSLSVSNDVQAKFEVLSNDTQVKNTTHITNSNQPDATVHLQPAAQPTNTATTSTKAQRRNQPLPAVAVSAMALWYKEHEKYPYPSRDQMEQWAAIYGLKFDQVKKWFANQRQRDSFAQNHPQMSVRGRKLSCDNTEELTRRGMENKRKRIRGASVDTKIKKHKSE